MAQALRTRAGAALALISLAAHGALAASSSLSSASSAASAGSTSNSGSGHAAQPVAAIGTNNFQQCFCWDATTNNFCNGDKWYNADACNDWLVNNFWWVPLTLLGAIVLILFPCCFYLSRCCCNCCGGRYATRGCCCAESSTRATFPGYKNRSILWTKIAFLVLTGAIVSVSVQEFVTAAKLNDAIRVATGAVDGAVTDFANTYNDAVVAAALLPTELVSTDFTLSLGGVSTTFNGHASDVHSRINDVNRTESNHVRPITDIVVAQGLALLFFGIICCLCSCHRAVGAVMATFTWHLVLVVLVLLPHQMARVAMHDACDNYDATIVPLVVGGLTKAGACNNAELTSGISGVQANTMSYLTQPSGTFCVDFKRACNAAGTQCTTTPCNDWASYETNNGLKYVSQYVWPSDMATAVAQIARYTTAFSSLEDTNDAGLKAAIQRLANYRTVTSPSLVAILGPLATNNHNCGGVVQRLDSTQFFDAVCGVRGPVATTSGWLVMSTGLGLAMIVVLVLAMKRFRRMGTYGVRSALIANEYEPLNSGRSDDVVVAAVCRGSMAGPGEVSGIVVIATPPPAAATKATPDPDVRPYGAANYGATEGSEYRRV